jgi:hypothetical protein
MKLFLAAGHFVESLRFNTDKGVAVNPATPSSCQNIIISNS